MPINKEILIAKYLSGNADPEEVKKLNEWRDQNPANQEEFDRAERVWTASLDLKKDRDADVDSAWNEFKQLTETRAAIAPQKRGFGWMRVAAAVVVFAMAALMVKLFDGSPVPKRVAYVKLDPISEEPEPIAEELMALDTMLVDSIIPEAAPKNGPVKSRRRNQLPLNGGLAMVTLSAGDSAQIYLLPDNSIVYLNAHSKLEYPQNFNKTNRRVALVGEAYFDVKKDSGQFVVACENTIIRGKATMFNVKSHSSDKDVEVIVASGFVEFSGVGYKDFKKLVINGGESGYYNKAKSVITKSKHQRKNYRWWQKRSLRAKIKAFFDKLMGRKH